VGRRTDEKWRIFNSTRHVPWIVLVFFLVALLILSGCGQESEDTASDPEANTATEQSSEPNESGQATEARINDLMSKVNERLDLSEDQETQIRAIMQEYLLTMEKQMEARQAQFAGQGTPGSQRGSRSEGDRPEMTDEMVGMMQKQQGQQESLNEEIQAEKTHPPMISKDSNKRIQEDQHGNKSGQTAYRGNHTGFSQPGICQRHSSLSGGSAA
jgi:hypothetical protein